MNRPLLMLSIALASYAAISTIAGAIVAAIWRYRRSHAVPAAIAWLRLTPAVAGCAITGGRVRIKVAGRHGETLNAAPEFDDCLRVAEATGRPLKLVQAEAMRAWAERGATRFR